MKTITGSFTSPAQAERALNTLLDHKAGIMEIGLLLRNCQPGRQRSETVIAHARIGAIAGAALGSFAGFAAGTSNVASPRSGIAAVIGALLGVFAVIMAGAGMGAVGGGLAGTLVGLDVSEDKEAAGSAEVHFEEVLVTVTTFDENAPTVEDIMWQARAVSVTSEDSQWPGNQWLHLENVLVVDAEYPMS